MSALAPLTAADAVARRTARPPALRSIATSLRTLTGVEA
jgi:hypothetical protein